MSSSTPNLSAMLTAFKQICKDLKYSGSSDYKKKAKKCLQQLIMMNFNLEMATEHQLKKLVSGIPAKSDLKLMVLAKIERLEKKRPSNSEVPAAEGPSPPVITPFGNGYWIPKKPKATPTVIAPKPMAPMPICQETKRTATSEVHVAKETYSPVLAPMNGYRIPKKQPLKSIGNCFSTSSPA